MLHASSRTVKIAGVAALAGMMMTVAIVAATHKSESAPSPPVAVREDVSHDRLGRELDRCATLTMPDAGCEAAWAENRRRFFRQPATEAEDGEGTAPSPENSAP
ncbi:putative entry exclusion protein TrbK-alt [Rhizorhabdus wittichii]|uniref:Entry exclusion protein TrbK-alt n=1 Tax=Rhizorhabdus wittichii TaxID=160791 RepID=A0A975D6A1_9SPHN|nr:putative entry exclusion protein TrbK-alt [Rhizorhabdus wittichii]QTH22450.1 putative entry exclusion protein TrbK-alt [Rhizorhabdus wittichii]